MNPRPYKLRWKSEKLKQKGQAAKEFIWEFRCIAGKLRQWPEWLLVYHFKESLDWELLQACIYQGGPE